MNKGLPNVFKFQRIPKYILHHIINIYLHVNLNNLRNFPNSGEWSKEWLFVHIVIKRTPQGIYHAPEITLYHVVSIWKQPDSSWIQISRKPSWAYLGPLSLSLLTWTPLPSSVTNIRWWCSLHGSEKNYKLGAVPVGLDSTLEHYVSHPITISHPSYPVLLSLTLPPSPQRLPRSPPPPLNSYHPAPHNTLSRRTHWSYPILLARAFILPFLCRLTVSAWRWFRLLPSAKLNLHWPPGCMLSTD